MNRSRESWCSSSSPFECARHSGLRRPQRTEPEATAVAASPTRRPRLVAWRGACSAFRGGGLRRPEPIGHKAGIRDELEIRSPGHHLEQRREVLVAESLTDQTHNDLMGECRERKGHAALPCRLEAELEVLAQEVTREGRRVIEVHECRRLVAAE